MYTANRLTKHFALHALVGIRLADRNGDTPGKISGQRTWSQSALETRIDQLSVRIDDRVWRPISSLVRLLDPFLRLRLNFVQGEIRMNSFFRYNFVCLADKTPRVDKFNGVQRLPAEVTLVTSCVLDGRQQKNRLQELEHQHQTRNEGRFLRQSDLLGTCADVRGHLLCVIGPTHFSHPVQYVCSFDCLSRHPFLPMFV